MFTLAGLRRIIYFLISILVFSSLKHMHTNKTIRELEKVLLNLEEKQSSSEKISSLLSKTEADLGKCLRTSEELIIKIRGSRGRVSSESLKLCMENNSACSRQKFKDVVEKKTLRNEIENLSLQLKNLSAVLDSKTSREKQLAQKLEDLRRLNIIERAGMDLQRN